MAEILRVLLLIKFIRQQLPFQACEALCGHGLIFIWYNPFLTIWRNSHKLNSSMKSLTLSCLICALNLYFAQKLLEVVQKLEITIGTGLSIHKQAFQNPDSLTWGEVCICHFSLRSMLSISSVISAQKNNKQTNKQNNNNNNNKNIAACQWRIQTFRWGGSGLQKIFFCPSGLNKGGIQER